MDIDETLDVLTWFIVKQKCVFCNRYPTFNALWCGKCEYHRVGRVKTRYGGSFTDVIAAIEYSGSTRSAMWRLKDEGDRRVIRLFAQEMKSAMDEYWKDVAFDLLIPIPMNPTKKAERGYNQAELLAKRLSKLTSLPVEFDAMIRQEGMQTQHKLTAYQRLENAKQSYKVVAPELIENRIVLLVDDLLTTGATLNVCADKLLASGAKSAYAITAQWTKGNQQRWEADNGKDMWDHRT